MIQFNLLPDVKKVYLKTKKTKRMIVGISTITVIASISIVAFLLIIVQVFQKNNISDLSADINSEISSIQSIEGLQEILTVQNQLENIPALHEKNVVSSRLFTYFGVLKPTDVTISSLEINFVENTMVIEGEGESLASINKFADTLKFAEYSTTEIESFNPFTTVITELNRSENESNFKITLVFDPIIFSNTENGVLVVPNKITTRSTVNKPDINPNDLFQESTGGEQ